MRTVAARLFAFAVLVALVAVPDEVTARSTPLPSPTPTQPPRSAVKAACVPKGVDYHVDRWNFVAPYLLCDVSDQFSGNRELLRRNADGSFSNVSHGGGNISLADLKLYGVPVATAQQLLAGMHP